MLGTGAGLEIARGFDYARQTLLPDTRVVAQQWIYANIEEGAEIHREYYTPPISEERYRASVVGISGLIRRPFPTARYLVASSEDYSRYLHHPDRYAEPARRYRVLFAENVELRRFEADGRTMLGPTIRVVRTRRRGESAQTARAKPLAPRENRVPIPEVRFGHTDVEGGLSATQVRAAAQRRRNDLTQCYRVGLSTSPDIAGRITIRFTVAPSGRVTEAEVGTANFADEVTHACLVRAFRNTEFAHADPETQVTFPLVLSSH